MPQIIPIRDLKNTTAISQKCMNSREPIFVTKNGYGDMVIMSMKVYEEKMFMQDVYAKVAEAEQDFTDGNEYDAKAALADVRSKYGL